MIDELDDGTIPLPIVGMVRHNDHSTSKRAASGVRRFTLRERVIEHARLTKNYGFTDDELKADHPQHPESSFRKRRTELAQENRIVETGALRANRFGQAEKVWVHRDFHPSPPPIVERDTTPKQSKLARLEAQLAEALDLVARALPYVETAQGDPLYKPGSVVPLTNRMRKFIEAN